MARTENQSVTAVIPARYASQRFPGKPLANILGKTLIQRTYENACRCTVFDKVIVATDDQRIYDHVCTFTDDVVMTSPECATGTDRLIEVVRDNDIDASIIVNVQGDEPCLSAEVVEDVVAKLKNDDGAVVATPVALIKEKEDVISTSVVKCVFDRNGNALYFSRASVPSGKTKEKQNEAQHYRHIGIYAYRRDFLLKYGELEDTPLQLTEDLEQLKILEHGFRIKVAIVHDEAIGVDNPEDIKKIETILCNQNTSL
jgi:3-deoxy-manno-octulosonate cytidylyltransferase (CMP-KDO synthetase)